MTEHQVEQVNARLARLRPLIETIERLGPEIERDEQIKSSLLSKEGNAPTEAERKRVEKSRLAMAANIDIHTRELNAARAELAPRLTSASHFAREVTAELRATAHARAEGEWSKHVDAQRACEEACSDTDVRLVDDTIGYLESLGSDPLARAKRFVALLEKVLAAEATASQK